MKKLLSFLAGLVLAMLAIPAMAQSPTPATIGPNAYPNWYSGYVPTPQQWALWWSNKLDYYPGGLPIALGGCGATTVQGCLTNLGITGNSLPVANIWVGNVSNVATPQVMSGDCTASLSLAITCVSINGVPVTLGGAFTTGSAFNLATRASKTANYTVLAADNGKGFDNIGASGSVNFTLPTAAAGLTFRFTVKAAQTLTVTAGASTTISIGQTISAAAGNITANLAYSSVCLEAISTTEWVACAYDGNWTVN